MSKCFSDIPAFCRIGACPACKGSAASARQLAIGPPGHPVGKRYLSDVVTRAHAGGSERIVLINVRGLRHAFPATAFAEADGDILSASRASGYFWYIPYAVTDEPGVGVLMAAGNSNFGDAFCLAGDIIAAKCRTKSWTE